MLPAGGGQSADPVLPRGAMGCRTGQSCVGAHPRGRVSSARCADVPWGSSCCPLLVQDRGAGEAEAVGFRDWWSRVVVSVALAAVFGLL